MKTVKQMKKQLNNQLAQIELEKSLKTKTNLCKLAQKFITEQVADVKMEIANTRKIIENLSNELDWFPFPKENVDMCKIQLHNSHIKLNKLNQVLEYLIDCWSKLFQLRFKIVPKTMANFIYRLVLYIKLCEY